MYPPIETVVDYVRLMIAEEAHLVGQELQDALGHDELHRLQELSSVLDDLADHFAGRSTRRLTP